MIRLKYTKTRATALEPRQATAGSACLDLAAAETIKILPGETMLVGTGLSFEFPSAYEMQLRPRSGMSLKTGLRFANSVGTIDSDFRGEVCVLAWNAGKEPLTIRQGQYIAQAILAKRVECRLVEVSELTPTERGCGGFGHSG